MKTILVGFADDKRLTEQVLIAGSHIPTAEQIQIFEDAKRRNIYPPGITRLEMHEDKAINVAIRIGEPTRTKTTKK